MSAKTSIAFFCNCFIHAFFIFQKASWAVGATFIHAKRNTLEALCWWHITHWHFSKSHLLQFQEDMDAISCSWSPIPCSSAGSNQEMVHPGEKSMRPTKSGLSSSPPSSPRLGQASLDARAGSSLIPHHSETSRSPHCSLTYLH